MTPLEAFRQQHADLYREIEAAPIVATDHHVARGPLTIELECSTMAAPYPWFLWLRLQNGKLVNLPGSYKNKSVALAEAKDALTDRGPEPPKPDPVLVQMNMSCLTPRTLWQCRFHLDWTVQNYLRWTPEDTKKEQTREKA